ncbi:MAG TPA: hypothetical protein VN663_07950 [Ramlibacter sp.]|nr:hypothetical protein [Ramlibacter sp.]
MATVGTAITRIEIGNYETQVAIENGPAPVIFRLAMGATQIGSRPFAQRPPSALELENAIATVEDLVMPLAKLLPPDTTLVSSDYIAVTLVELLHPGHEPAGGMLSLAQVEQVFDELAAVSLGRPASTARVPTDNAFFAYVLILREFMHHLAFKFLSVPGAA